MEYVGTSNKPLVRNSADKGQVKKAENKVKSNRDNELLDLQNVLETPAGRRFIWRVLGKCKTFESIWAGSALIHFNAGQQDIGHWLLQEIGSADEKSFLTLMTENYKGDK